MVRSSIVLASLLIPGISGARRAQVQHETTALSKAKAVAMVGSLMKDMTIETAETNPICNSMWSTELDDIYHDKNVVGSGATACVYLARQNSDNRMVAVKVGKETESLSQWQQECTEMRLLRVGSCRAGRQINELNRQFIPTCLGVGTTDRGNYYIMHAAGTEGIEDITGRSVQERKSIFAQFIGAIFAMHALDYTHNDLHGQNIVLDGNKLAIIDFGNMVNSELAARSTYMRDGNAAWRWTALLADCPGDAWWSETAGGFEARQLADNFKRCLRERWHADDGSIDAFEGVLNKDIHELPTQGIRRLFQSRLVQENLPRFEEIYPWEGADGCLDWTPAESVEALRRVEFSSHYKCPSVPTYIKEHRRFRHGRERIRHEIQCEFQSSACYSSVPNVQWACGGGLVRTVHCDAIAIPDNQRELLPPGHNNRYEGACLQQLHQAYHVAQGWPGWVSTTTTTTTFHRRFEFITTRPRRTTTPPPLLAPNNPLCQCSATGIVHGEDTGRPGCAAHIGANFGNFCYIEGGEECPGARFSRSKNAHYLHC
jgi:tRNA A-37 threonylcarbamoyl transferase component Bud32